MDLLNTMKEQKATTLKQEVIEDVVHISSEDQDEMEFSDVGNDMKMSLPFSLICEQPSQQASSDLVPTLKAEIQEGDINILNIIRYKQESYKEDIITSSQLASSALVPTLKAEIKEGVRIKQVSHDDNINTVVMIPEESGSVPLKNLIVKVVKLEYQGRNSNEIPALVKRECNAEDNSGDDDCDPISERDISLFTNDMDGSFDGNTMQRTVIQDCNFPSAPGEQDFGKNSTKEKKKRKKFYKCKICTRTFSFYNSLWIHKRTHTGEKPHKCSICSFQTAHPGGLKLHLRVHSGEKPYKCHVCPLQFSCSQALKQHLGIHFGIKPYECNICTYKCSRVSHLKDHIKAHTVRNLISVITVHISVLKILL